MQGLQLNHVSKRAPLLFAYHDIKLPFVSWKSDQGFSIATAERVSALEWVEL